MNELGKNFEREGLDIELIHGDISKVKLEEDRFDLLFCLDVLEHIPDVEEVVRNIRRILSNDGLLIGTLPLRENLYANTVMCPKCKCRFHTVGHHPSFETIEEIKQLGPQFSILETGEVRIFKNVSDIITYALMKITRSVLRKDIALTIYFVARLAKD